MEAVILEQPRLLAQVSLPEPAAPGPGQVLVRTRRVGVCGTDYHAFHGEQPFFSYPRILGHELGVEVVAIGEGVTHLAVGDRGAVRPYFNCGHCPPCRRGKPNCCMNLQVFGVHIDGGLRELAVIPAAHLHPSPTLTFDQLALVEPLAIGAHAVARAQLVPGERVLVAGAGPIGLAVMQFALLTGAEIAVFDISEQRLAFCQRLWPAVHCFSPQGDLPTQLQQRYGDDLPTAVFDATGNQRSMQATFQYVGFGGRLIFVGFGQQDITFANPLFHSHEMTILASRNALATDFQGIIAALEAGQIDLEPWITHRTDLASFTEALPQWLAPTSGIIKGVIAV